MNSRSLTMFVAVFLCAVLAISSPAGAAATLLPPGESCFQATTPTSGGSAGVITALGTIASGGSGYVSNSYANVPLTGGSGAGAVATIIVSGGSVSAVILTNPGFHYSVGDNLSASNANLGGTGSGFLIPVSTIQGTGTGLLGLLGPITGGSAYTSGTFSAPLTGGLGSGATANITISGGAVTAVAITNPGVGYVVGDALSATAASIGGTGSGFSVSVLSVAINSSLAGGSVGYFIPNTNTFKQTWQNAAQTILNQNPVPLDANGCAVVYGTGTYRQILKDALGNTVYDKPTTDTSANNNTFWAGLASGTANAITVTDTGFNGTDGSIIQFVPLLTNTGPATFNPSNYFGVLPPAIVKDTSAGAVALTGGEIVANSPSNVVSLIYSATQGNFHILNLIEPSLSSIISPPTCSASGLRIANSAAGPSIFSIGANQVVMINPVNGAFITRGTPLVPIAVTVNFSINGAGGLDTGSVAPGTWYYVYLVDNGTNPPTGTTPVGLGSASSSAPTLPSGYSSACRLGAVITDGSGIFYQLNQKGSAANYVITAGTNTAQPVNIANTSGGAAGTYSTTSPVLASVSYAGFVPPTADQFTFIYANCWKTGCTPDNMLIAPNTGWGGTNNGPGGSNGSVWPVAIQGNGGTIFFGGMMTFNVEASQTFGWATTGVGSAVSIYGWKDSVNAD